MISISRSEKWLKLKKENFTENIKVYYYDSFDKDLVQEVIRCLMDKDLDKGSMEFVKDGKGRQVFKLAVNDKKYYIKKYFYRKISKRIKNLFRSAEALRALKVSLRLLRSGVPVVQPVLAVVYRRDFWTVDSLFVTEDFQGIDLQSYLADGKYDQDIKSLIIKGTARLWAQFYKNNFINGDPNLGSILIKFTQSDFKLSLVDVDNTRHLLSLPERMVIKNLIEFNAHSYSGLDRIGKQKLSFEDRIIFMKEFILSYGRNMNFEKTAKYIDRKTVGRLLQWGKRELVNKDEGLRMIRL
jgi:hypothetical protein